MKSGKQVKITSPNENFKILTGAVENYKAPVSVYLNMTSWITSKRKIDSLNTLIKNYKFEVREYLKNNEEVTKYFDKDCIIEIETSSTGLKSGKPTFFSFELNLYQKKSLPLVKPKNSNMEDLMTILKKISFDVLSKDIFTNNPNFDFKLLKK